MVVIVMPRNTTEPLEADGNVMEVIEEIDQPFGEFDDCQNSGPGNDRKRYVVVRRKTLVYRQIEDLTLSSSVWMTEIGFLDGPACGDSTAINDPDWARKGNNIQQVSPTDDSGKRPVETPPATRGSRPENPNETGGVDEPAPTYEPGNNDSQSSDNGSQDHNPTIGPQGSEYPNHSNKPVGNQRIPSSTADTFSTLTAFITYTSDGNLYTTLVTQKTTIDPQATISSEPEPTSRYRTSNDSSNKGAIIGGAVVGALVFLLIGFALWYVFVLKKKQRQAIRNGNYGPPSY